MCSKCPKAVTGTKCSWPQAGPGSPWKTPSSWAVLTGGLVHQGKPCRSCQQQENCVTACRDIEAAGMQDYVQLSEGPCDCYQPDPTPTLVVTNPPWGARLTEHGMLVLRLCLLLSGGPQKLLLMLSSLSSLKGLPPMTCLRVLPSRWCATGHLPAMWMHLHFVGDRESSKRGIAMFAAHALTFAQMMYARFQQYTSLTQPGAYIARTTIIWQAILLVYRQSSALL